MNMTTFQREGLRLLGYTKLESEFLYLVATHSGYFTNHQFKTFSQTDSGSVSHAFIRRLLERKHATYRAYRSGERVYHLFARKVYQAIEREHLRTRKKHEVEYVKTRLVALDFVLGHLEHRYLETEEEKVGFFEKKYVVGQEVLPVKLYRARKSAEVTPRYFVDRYPLFLDRTTGALTFTYIDSGAVTLDAFGTHLRAYLGLLHAIHTFDFLYLAPSSRLFRAAESLFHEAFSGRHLREKSVSLLEYFRLRKAWDAIERVRSADVILLKQAQARYATKQFDELFVRWQKGVVQDSDVLAVGTQPAEASRGVFRTLVCGSSLKVFADPLADSAETWAEPNTCGSAPQLSGRLSVEVSRA